MNKSTNISLSEDLWEAANILAIKKRISFTELVRQSLKDTLSGKHINVIGINEYGEVSPPEATNFIMGLSRIRSMK